MKRSEGLITNLGIKSPISEAFRTLRTNLEFISPDKSLKTVLVTSSGPGEGKSTIAANIALSMVQLGKKVLVIDCDLRKPVQHKVHELSNLQGLTNLLVNKESVSDKIIQSTEVKNYSVLTSGPIPPNPAEILGSQRMVHLLDELKEEYDLVILDTPPLISVTDAAVLSTIVDGSILVVCAGTAERNMVTIAKERLDKVKANILGVVMNKVEVKKSQEYYYYYYLDEKNHA